MAPINRRFCFLSVLSLIFVLVSWMAADAQAQFSQISVATDGTPANGPSESPSISGDGRFVVFASEATNLVANDTNASKDIFLRDRLMHTTTRVSVTTAGEERQGHSSMPSISQNGRFIVFRSAAALVADDTNPCNIVFADGPPASFPTCADIYVHDRVGSTTTRISVASNGAQGDKGATLSPSISGDGRFVVFTSDATNMVAGDTNDRTDAFLHDRQTGATTRISVTRDGNQSPLGSDRARITRDGRFIAYGGSAAREELPYAVDCPSTTACPATLLRDRETGAITLLSSASPAVTSGQLVMSEEPGALSADGRYIAIERSTRYIAPPSALVNGVTLLHDRHTGRTIAFSGNSVTPPGLLDDRIQDFSADGRIIATRKWIDGFGRSILVDRRNGLDESIVPPPSPSRVGAYMMSLSADAAFVAFATYDRLVVEDTTAGYQDIYVYVRDADGDGMPGGWETHFGLDPANPSDGASDPDSDGLTNLQEYQQLAHPNGTVKRYLAEGAQNEFFNTRLAAVNPNDVETDVVFRFLGASGQITALTRTLGPRSRTTFEIGSLGVQPENDFSTVIESDRMVVVDRTMTWDRTGFFGSHAETSIAAPATTWYLAEGATHGDFDLFYLIQNPNDVDVTVTIKYLRLAPLTPVEIVYTVPAHSRKTIWVDTEGPELEAVDTAAAISSTHPIIVERAMYSSRSGRAFGAGHGGAAVPAPALNWFLAEGATGQFFDLYVLVANPGTTEANLNVTYLLPGGERFTKAYSVGPQNRLTIGVDGEDPRLLDTPVSIIVESTNGQPIVVERTMLWPEGQWYEMHLSAGATTTGTRWTLADGIVLRSVGKALTETYILIANTGSTPGTATVTLLREDNPTMPIVTTVDLPASSRVTIPVSTLLPSGGASGGYFGTLIESNGVPIVVERAIYTDAGGVTWAAGTASLATKLQ